MSIRTERYPPPPGVRQRVDDWRRRLAEPGWVLLPARLFLGGTFLFAGLQKLADPHFFDAARPTSIQGQLAIFRHSSPIGALLGPVQSHAVAFGVLTAVAEIAVGLGTLLGLWARVAAVGGFLLSTSFFLTVSFHTKPYYYGSDVFVMVMWLPFIAIGTAGVLSLDGYLGRTRSAARPAAARAAGTAAPAQRGARRAPQVERRAVVATAGVAATAGVLAAADAALGRRFTRSGKPTAAPAGSAGSASPGAGGSGAGTAVAAAAQVPVGSAATFTDPSTGKPALVVQPAAGSFKAFSAICSHAGCTVDYQKSQQQFVCPCHGSVFDGATGAVLSGPAPTGLTPLPVTVVNGQIEVRKA